jgi:hypothetical protein
MSASAILHSCLSGCSGDFCLRLLERKEEFEAGAGTPVVCRGIKVQSTAVPGDDFCTDREPEPRTVASFGRKERFQNLCLNLCWNSWTCVRDLYIETVHRSYGGKTQGSPVWHRINCVADQICKDLPDLTLEANDWRHLVQPLPLNGYVRSTERALKECQR